MIVLFLAKGDKTCLFVCLFRFTMALFVFCCLGWVGGGRCLDGGRGWTEGDGLPKTWKTTTTATIATGKLQQSSLKEKQQRSIKDKF